MDQAEYRRLQWLLEPKLTPNDLDEFIIKEFGIELPWHRVDELSNGSSLEFIWNINETMLLGKGSHQAVLACSRNSAKTLSSAILQYIALLHFRRDTNHLAAVLSQANALLSYLSGFMNKPELLPYIKTDNTRTKEFVGLPPNDFTNKNYASIKVITASKKGANSTRCLDAKTQIITLRTDRKSGTNESSYSSRTTIKGIYDSFNQGKEVVVLSVNPNTLELENKKVVAVSRNINLNRITFKTASGLSISSTAEHLHSSHIDEKGKIKYKFAADFKIGDSILVKNPGSQKIKCTISQYCRAIKYDNIVEITHEVEKPNHRNRWVYDITVEDNNNFFANRVLTHNCSFITLDEVDLTPPEVLAEVGFVLDPTRDGHKYDPVSVYLSSRKTNSGPIQDLIDRAESPENKASDDPIRLYKWSQVDFMEKCKDEVSKINEGQFSAFINSENLDTIWSKEQFDAMTESRKSEYIERVAYNGCKTCSAWVACQGRSVHQQGLSGMLRTRSFVGRVLRAVNDPSAIVAQSLNWKPENSAQVFRMFSHFHHLKDPQDFYEWVSFGERFNPDNLPTEELDRIYKDGTYAELASVTPSKDDIYQSMVKHGWTMVGGVDWGHSPDPAVASVIGFHEKADLCGVLHVEHANGYANHRWAEYTSKNIFSRFPVEWVGPDTADKSSPSYFATHNIRSLNTKPARVDPGVSFVRGMLWDAVTNKPRYAILDDTETDDYNKFAVEEFEKYAHARDPNGRVLSDKYAQGFDHFQDQQRYALAPFADRKQITFSAGQSAEHQSNASLVEGAARNDQEAIQKIKEKELLMNQFKDHMFNQHGVSVDLTKPSTPETNKPEGGSTVRGSGGIKFSIG